MLRKIRRVNGCFLKQLGNMPVFWKYFLMMASLVLMGALTLGVSNRISLEISTERTLGEMQTELNHNCDELSNAMYMTYAIPEAVESSRYYNYLRNVDSVELPREYAAVLTYVGNALRNQLYLQGENVDCMIYFPRINSICTRYRNYTVADKCFTDYITFSHMTAQEVLAKLSRKSGVELLPVQNVKIGEAQTVPCMPLIICPANTQSAVMTIYAQDTILNKLKFPAFPEGTCLQIVAADGTVLMDYAKSGDYSAKERGFSIQSDFGALNASITVWVPESYFTGTISQSQLVGWILIGITVLLGLGLCVLFSNLSARPIRRIVSVLGRGDAPIKGNELAVLNSLVIGIQNDVVSLEHRLAAGRLIRALSGAILSEQDREHLAQTLGDVSRSYRVAILCAAPEITCMLSSDVVSGWLPKDFFFQPISSTESGLLFWDSVDNLQRLQNGLAQMREDILESGQRVQCGVSARTEDIGLLHIAVRQAHVALLNGTEFAVYHGAAANNKSVSWFQYEVMYQKIMSNDEEGTLAALKSISGGAETFYSIRFMLRSAANEAELPFSENEILHYDSSLPGSQNILRLEKMVKQMFFRIREKQNQIDLDWKLELQSYIRENFSDYGMCAAAVASEIGLTEKRVYSGVRAATGMSFNEYLVCLRMEKAGRLLLTSQEGVAEIAEKCGYQAINTFYRVFKKYYGIAPAEYRKSGGKSEDADEL